jgi:transcription elongation factor GreA
MDEHEFLTESKKQELEEEMQRLKTTVRSEILERLAFAKSLGDLSENAEYHSSKESQGKNEGRISQIEAVLKDAIIVEANTDGIIGLGSTITLEKKGTGEQKVYSLVGNEEADFSNGKISFTSPIGSAIMDKQTGDIVVVTTPKGDVHYVVKNVQ